MRKAGLCPWQRGHPPGALGKARERGLGFGGQGKGGHQSFEDGKNKGWRNAGDVQAGQGFGQGLGGVCLSGGTSPQLIQTHPHTPDPNTHTPKGVNHPHPEKLEENQRWKLTMYPLLERKGALKLEVIEDIAKDKLSILDS